MTVAGAENPQAGVRAQSALALRPIALVGLMGVGKTTVGRRLAAQLGVGFIDADAAIEAAAHLSISEIFDAFGEAYFRDGERRVIRRLLAEGAGVIATGGGAFCQPQTRAMLLEHARVVWLDCDVDTLVERTGRRDTRPLLRDGDRREVLARLAEERRPLYAQAHVHVQAQGGPHSRTVHAILEALASWK
ncbi:shikimate kinase [Porphyrobacter sp. GA68]|uniref:shikimate kinase n=1 Tax=Porphyrobacter sp. GA68 TaxID=2883480 RepID=UPI001D18FDA1|nr:shikimate kinase [Porphyrobacter sp. GA68]